MIAEADVVRGRQAVSVRRVKASCSTIVYSAASPANSVDSFTAVRNDCVQCTASGQVREVAKGFTNESDICVCVLEPVFELFNGDQVGGDSLLNKVSKGQS